MEIGDRFKLNQTEAALTTLVAITGSIHVAVGLNTGYQTLALAGAGFIGGAGLFLAGPRIDDIAGLDLGFSRAALSGLVLPYTGYQFVAYYVYYNGFHVLAESPVAAVDKLVQTGVLALASLYLYRRLME
jgi:hypothetical protein